MQEVIEAKRRYGGVDKGSFEVFKNISKIQICSIHTKHISLLLSSSNKKTIM